MPILGQLSIFRLCAMGALLVTACDDSASGSPDAGGNAASGGGPSGGMGAADPVGGDSAAGATGVGGSGGEPWVPVGPEPTGLYNIVDHDVTALPAGIGLHDQDYEYLLHLTQTANWENAPGEAFDGRNAARFYPRDVNDGYAGIRELHFENTIPGLTRLNVRWLAKYSNVAHQAFSGNKQLIIVRTEDPLGLEGTGRSISLWRPNEGANAGMVLGPCDGIVCRYYGADPPYWPDGSDTFWIGPQANGGHADEWISFEQEYVTDAPRVLSGSPAAAITTVAGSDTVELGGAHFTDDVEVYDTLTIHDGPDASRYIVREVVSDTVLRVWQAPVGFEIPVDFAGGAGSFTLHHAYSKLYIHTRDGAFAGEYVTVPQWDTGAFGTIEYFDVLGGYFGPSIDMGDDGWFMLDRVRLDDSYIGPPEGFVK
jgi:hypothetical protein